MDSRSRSSATIQYSGVAVRVRPDRIEAACREVGGIPGVEVRLRHPDGERLVAVIEARGEDAQAERLRQIRNVPGVLFAAPVFHYVDHQAGDGAPAAPPPARRGDR